MTMSEWMYLKEFSMVFILLMLCLCVYAFRYIEIYMHMFTHSPSPTHRNSKVTLKTKQNKRYIGKMLITSQANFCINCQSNELLLAAPLLMKDFQLFLETIFQCKKINSCRKQQKIFVQLRWCQFCLANGAIRMIVEELTVTEVIKCNSMERGMGVMADSGGSASKDYHFAFILYRTLTSILIVKIK